MYGLDDWKGLDGGIPIARRKFCSGGLDHIGRELSSIGRFEAAGWLPRPGAACLRSE
jgi:hypothetical protein